MNLIINSIKNHDIANISIILKANSRSDKLIDDVKFVSCGE
jgi:hypothetical protein